MTLDDHREALTASRDKLRKVNAEAATVYAAQRKLIKDAYRDGLDVAEISRLIDRSASTALHGVRRDGEPMPHTGRADPPG